MSKIDIHDDGKGGPQSIRASAELDPDCTPGTITVRAWAGSEKEALEKLHDSLLDLSSDVSREIQNALEKAKSRYVESRAERGRKKSGGEPEEEIRDLLDKANSEK